ncbi:hypothetical protein [Streptomyces syringium]|uniref:hypothetical protein n=1 Tax=Streptomyces syringium TaxID=76729 RepID=UPI003AAA3F4A
MSPTHYTWSPLRCTKCVDPDAQFVPEDSDCPDSLLCTKCLQHGHLPYITTSELRGHLTPGQVLGFHDGVMHVGTPQTDTDNQAPEGLTAYTRRVVELAESKVQRATWKPGKASHLLVLRSSGPHGPLGHITIGARSGKVLRAELAYGRSGGRREYAEGTNAVRALLAALPVTTCPPHCQAETPEACAGSNQR